jgi:hypothetical protein
MDPFDDDGPLCMVCLACQKTRDWFEGLFEVEERKRLAERTRGFRPGQTWGPALFRDLLMDCSAAESCGGTRFCVLAPVGGRLAGEVDIFIETGWWPAGHSKEHPMRWMPTSLSSGGIVRLVTVC